MSLSFEKTPLLLSLFGGVSITSAVVGMNTLPSKPLQMLTGMPLFSIGWILMISSFVKNSTRDSKYKSLLVISSILVYMAAMMTRMMMEKNVSGLPINMTKIVFMMAWISIGVFMGMKNHGHPGDSKDEIHDPTIHGLAMIPPVLVFVAMMSVNSLERPKNLASGPGMPLFMLAWSVLSMVNSVQVV